MRQARVYPDPILFTKAEDFNFETDKLLIKELEDAAKEGFGWGKLVGLAAPQIGISKRFFLALGKLYVNPMIKMRSKTTYFTNEGCYSLGEHAQYAVERYSWIMLDWQDRDGKNHFKKFDGLRAQVIQHEHDHLVGKLCCE